jgi:hypothetical protein
MKQTKKFIAIMLIGQLFGLANSVIKVAAQEYNLTIQQAPGEATSYPGTPLGKTPTTRLSMRPTWLSRNGSSSRLAAVGQSTRQVSICL